MKGRFTVVQMILWVAMIPDAVINGTDGAPLRQIKSQLTSIIDCWLNGDIRGIAIWYW